MDALSSVLCGTEVPGEEWEQQLPGAPREPPPPCWQVPLGQRAAVELSGKQSSREALRCSLKLTLHSWLCPVLFGIVSHVSFQVQSHICVSA